MKLKLFISTFLLSLVVATNIYAQEKLIFAVDIIRHGDRTPIKNIPNAPHEWPEGLGQLTATGMQQEYQLGSKQRAMYVEQYHLLPAHYTVDTMYVRSSDFDRPLMSAQSFLLGLYPLESGPKLPNSVQFALPAGYQPIPIHTIPFAQENLLIPDSDFYHFDDLLKRYFFSTKEWKEKNAMLQPKFKSWSKIFGVSITDAYQLKSIGDTLYVNQLYHLPLPAGLSEEDAAQIINTGKWILIAPAKIKKITYPTGQQLTKTILSYLQQAAQKKTTLKYVLYSAHDSTLLAQMGILGVPLNEVPRYASDLNFSLFDMGNEKYAVKVTFNDQPLLIPGCNNVMCPLTQFSALVNSF